MPPPGSANLAPACMSAEGSPSGVGSWRTWEISHNDLNHLVWVHAFLGNLLGADLRRGRITRKGLDFPRGQKNLTKMWAFSEASYTGQGPCGLSSPRGARWRESLSCISKALCSVPTQETTKPQMPVSHQLRWLGT